MDITEGRERDNLVSHQQVDQRRQSFSWPSYNPKIFEDFAGPSNNVGFFTNANNNVVPAPVLEPCPAYQQQQPWALNIFNNTAPPLAAVSTMATTVTYEPQFSHDKQQDDICLPRMAGPFPWPLVMQQDMFQPQAESCRIQPLAGDIFTVMTGAGTFGASMTTAEAGVHVNIDNSHIQSVNLGTEQQGDDRLAAMMMDMHTKVDSAMVPQDVGINGITAKEKASAMPYNGNDNNANHNNDGSFMALDRQVFHGMASDMIDSTMVGGAYGSNDASLVAPRGLVIVAPNGNQLALADNMDGSPMGLVQSPGTVLDWKSNLAAIFSSPWYEENDFFPVEALLGQQDAPMHDVAFDGRQVDATEYTNCDAGGDVATCRSSNTALKVLTGGKLKDVNVVLINAVKAATCGFAFRDIVERDLSIPVIYFMPLDHKAATGEEMNKLIRTLLAATFTISKPFDIEELHVLWRVIAWHKCYLNASRNHGVGGFGRVPSSWAALMARSAVDKKRRAMEGNKKKGGKASKFQQPQAMDDHQLPQQQQSMPPHNPRVSTHAARKTKNPDNTDTSAKPKVSTTRPPRYPAATPARRPVPSPLTPASPAPPPVNRRPTPPPHPMFPTTPAPARPPAIHAVPVPAREPPTVPLVHHNQQPTASGNIFGGAMAPSATTAATTMPAATVTNLEPQVTQQQQDMNMSPSMLGPFPYQCPRPPVTRRRETGAIILDFKQPHSCPLFTAMASDRPMTFGASAPAHAGAYGNAASPLSMSLSTGAADELSDLSDRVTMHTNATSSPPVHQPLISDEAIEAAIVAALNKKKNSNSNSNYTAGSLDDVAPHQHVGHGMVSNVAAAAATKTLNIGDYINYNAGPVLAPQHVGHDDVAAYEAAPMDTALLNANSFRSNYGAGSYVAPGEDQVLGMASNNVNELTMAGGAFGTNFAVPSMAPEDLVATAQNNDNNQLAPGELDNLLESLMGPQQSSGEVMNGNPGLKAMFPDDPYKNTMFQQLQNILLEQDGQHGGATGGAATAANAAGTTTLPIGGERDMGIWGIGAADSFEMPDGFFVNGTGDFMFQHDVNMGRRE
ncbi:hypothetical protein HU200_006493 [Digitaria exilis]|uniref:Uncharacterized protein n=1 Tax=Digitaria exilis TaxID=1010633 RepID=A0A835KVG4_9POAL|nr:hypothetical protein HU200_006493 [Digitaria exilis]